MDYDLIVIGLGPAGSIAARKASRLGLKVLALDCAHFPRSKVCGGGLSPRASSFFDGEAIPAVETAVTGLGLSYKGTLSTVDFKDPIAFLVCRDRFDHALLLEAEISGTKVLTGERVVRMNETPDGIIVLTEKGEYRAKAVIGADGALGFTSRVLNPPHIRKGFPGIEGEFSLPKEKSGSQIEIDVGISPGGYGWIFPKGERTSVGIAAMGQKREIRKHFIDYTSGRGKSSDKPVHGEGHPLPLWSKELRWKIRSNRLLLAGDAAGLVDPFFGEGIYYAMRSGEMAAFSVHQFIRHQMPLSTYEEAVRRELYPEFQGARRLARIVYSNPGLFFRLASKYPGVLELYADILRGKRFYRNFLSTVFLTALRKLFQY